MALLLTSFSSSFVTLHPASLCSRSVPGCSWFWRRDSRPILPAVASHAPVVSLEALECSHSLPATDWTSPPFAHHLHDGFGLVVIEIQLISSRDRSWG